MSSFPFSFNIRALFVDVSCVVFAETGAETKVKLEEGVTEEELSLEMTSSDAATSFTTSCDMSQGDDVVSSTSDVFSCDYEGRFSVQFVSLIR